jgi:hypothetical protein
MANLTNDTKRRFRWADVVVPSHDLEDATPANRQRMLRILTADPLGLADLVDAVTVILLSKTARRALQAADPKGLEQLETSLVLSSPSLPNPYEDGQAVVFRDAEHPEFVVAQPLEANGARVAFVFGDGTSKFLSPWDFRTRPDDDPQAE